MRILIITKWLPYPPISGNPIRNYNLFLRAAKKHKIWLLSYADPEKDKADINHLEKHVGSVTAVRESKTHALYNPLGLIKYLFSGTPPDLRIFQSKDMIDAIINLTSSIQFDIVQIEDSFFALHWKNLPPRLQERAILTFHDVGFMKYRRMYPLEPSFKRKLRLWLHSKMMLRWEPSYAENFPVCLTMSEIDRSILMAENSDLNIKVIPNGIDTQTFLLSPREVKEKKHLIFVGNMGYRPNVDGAIFFIKDIFPLVRKKFPQTELWLVGVNPSPEILQFKEPGIHITGRVDDIVPYYTQSDVCIVPLRAGSGTRLKILESMAIGRPVVTTSIGCEGLDVLNETHIFIADDPIKYADYINQLLGDEELFQEITQNARQLVEEKYDWDVIVKKLLTIYNLFEEKVPDSGEKTDE